jgi:hypothetical protein
MKFIIFSRGPQPPSWISETSNYVLIPVFYTIGSICFVKFHNIISLFGSIVFVWFFVLAGNLQIAPISEGFWVNDLDILKWSDCRFQMVLSREYVVWALIDSNQSSRSSCRFINEECKKIGKSWESYKFTPPFRPIAIKMVWDCPMVDEINHINFHIVALIGARANISCNVGFPLWKPHCLATYLALLWRQFWFRRKSDWNKTTFISVLFHT